jgi:hypothetical protein
MPILNFLASGAVDAAGAAAGAQAPSTSVTAKTMLNKTSMRFMLFSLLFCRAPFSNFLSFSWTYFVPSRKASFPDLSFNL